MMRSSVETGFGLAQCLVPSSSVPTLSDHPLARTADERSFTNAVVLEIPSKSSFHVKESSHCGDNSMTNYLHCNSCYFRPGMGVQRRFFITNCSHLYCEVCVDASTKDKCKVCKSQCSTLCLSGKIPKEVESMFSDPVESFQKFLKDFFQRLDFQRSHQKRLMKHMTEQLNNAEKKMKEVNKIIQQFQQLERSGPRSGASPGALYQSPSPSQTISTFGKNHGFTSLQHRQSGGSNISAGRLLIRTPPSGGRLGTVGGSCFTPTITRRERLTPNSNSGTPLTVPRPIQFNTKD
ncbi:RING finger protein 212B [Elysia marginata]|uniref:RING finger protein 212B n=1 Tax=Elysia marginata TaxID=1093978 RepID=A0AAV4EEF2_9GAST|nr:RING finger protein 212B [Elysia marginata]